jgi:hypothetical protein
MTIASSPLDSTLNGPIADNRYRRLLESAPDGIVEVDGSGRIVLVNCQVERLFGHRREELLGRSAEYSCLNASGSVILPTEPVIAPIPLSGPWDQVWTCEPCVRMAQNLP